TMFSKTTRPTEPSRPDAPTTATDFGANAYSRFRIVTPDVSCSFATITCRACPFVALDQSLLGLSGLPIARVPRARQCLRHWLASFKSEKHLHERDHPAARIAGHCHPGPRPWDRRLANRPGQPSGRHDLDGGDLAR